MNRKVLKMLSPKLLKTLIFASVSMSCIQGISPVMADDNVKSIIKDGKFFGQMRYRYEFVEQDGIANDAKASTVRTNIGFKTGEYKNFQGMIEGQLVRQIGANSFNSTTNGKTTYPTVADPNVAEINQAWVTWNGIPDTSIKIGRQAVNLDNQRFIGTVGWRQNDQTYDAVLLSNSSIENLDLSYAYVRNVNRIQGGDHALGDLKTNTHLARASYKVSDWLNLVGYGYWLDINEAASLSSKTYGVRATGITPINSDFNSDWSFAYELEYAKQSDHSNNTANYDESYYHISPSISGYGLTLQAGYEVLGGDGVNSFQTPLATGHKFNGWADKFLTTPANGLKDAYGKVAYRFYNSFKPVDGIKIAAIYHEFDGDKAGNYGSELNLVATKSYKLPEGQPFEKLNWLVKYADYNADDTLYTDTKKIWLQVGVNF